MEEAIKKINDEMQKNPSDPYTEIIGHYLIDRAGEEPEVARQIMQGGKSLTAAMMQVTELARKKQNKQVAVLTPGQVFGEIDRHFGIQPDPAAQCRSLGIKGGAAAAGAAPGHIEGGRPARGKVDIDLDDFL